MINMGIGILHKYKDHIDLDGAAPISMGEGDTPLIYSDYLSKETGASVYLKIEGCNPSGSFKDRGMVVAVCKALQKNKKILVCASTGNTSASASAYAAKFGLTSAIIIPSGNIAKGKLAQAMAFGAKIIAIDGSFDDALNIVRKLENESSIEIVNSINPHRIEGQKTAAFEIIDSLGSIDYLCIPVGNAGNISAYWKGFKEYSSLKNFDPPKMLGFQAEGAAPIVKGKVIDSPDTIATAIRIGNPASWKSAGIALAESNGSIHSVTDDEIIESYVNLARKDGVYCEPASAAGIAGLLKLSKKVDFNEKKITCVVTGNGLKDPSTSEKFASTNIYPAKSELSEVLEAINKKV
jgi:threonine synthase